MKFDFNVELERYFKSVDDDENRRLEVECSKCLFEDECDNNDCNNCISEIIKIKDAFRVVEKIKQWSIENPQKTILQDFKEKHPKAPLNEDGTPVGICPGDLGYEETCCYVHKLDCTECWNMPIDE